MNKLIVLVLIQNFVIGQIQVPPKDGLDLFNNIMRYLFNNCRTEFGTIGFWGDDRIFLANDEADFVVLNKSELFQEPPTRRIKSLVVIRDHDFDMPKLDVFEPMLTLEIETLFIFDKGHYSHTFMIYNFQWYQVRFENSKVYYFRETDGGIDIITMNAFANVAPGRWVKIEEIAPDYGDIIRIWRIYKTYYYGRYYYKNDEIYYDPEPCKSIFFDRIKKLDGYEIKVSAHIHDHSEPKFPTPNGLIDKTNENLQVNLRLNTVEKELRKVFTKYLNVYVNVTHEVPLNSSLPIGNMIIDGSLDLDLIPRIWELDENVDVMNHFYPAYPLGFYYDLIVTHNRGLASPLEKMFEFYGWLTIIATLVILLITFTVIYLSNSQNKSRLSFAIFECLRLLINNSINTRMDTVRMRIFFFVIFLYFLIIQATFSGNLAAFLTKPVYRKNVETLEDLKDPRYTAIYANTGSRTYIKDPVLLNKTKFVDFECEKYIHDKSVACIDQQGYLKKLIAHHNLHTPKHAVKFNFASLTMFHNWGLRHRVNNMVMRLVQSGISDLWRTNSFLKKSSQPDDIELGKLQDLAENYHRPIEMGDVTFAFVLLAVGLLSALISFMVEYLT